MLTSIELTNIMKELHNISGFRIALFDTEQKEVCAYPDNIASFCSLIQKNKNALALCRSYDKKAFQHVRETGEAYIYQCCFGLYEAVAPLYHFGILSGYLMMGQTLDSLPSSSRNTYTAALPYVADQGNLQSVLSEIPIRTKSQISSCITIMEICAGYITLANRLNADSKDLPSQIKNYLHQNYSSKITLEGLCSIFYCSRANLTGSFRKTFHVSIHEYLTRIRLSQAAVLLESSNFSIEQIAERCGFSDQNYFSKVFRKHYGMPPGNYRKISAQSN